MKLEIRTKLKENWNAITKEQPAKTVKIKTKKNKKFWGYPQ